MITNFLGKKDLLENLNEEGDEATLLNVRLRVSLLVRML